MVSAGSLALGKNQDFLAVCTQRVPEESTNVAV